MKHYGFILILCLTYISAISTNIETENILNYMNVSGKDVDIYKYDTIVNKGEAIILLHDTIYSPYDGEVYFIDKNPLSNWDHECSYLWQTNGKLIELTSTQPPLYMQNWEKIHKNNKETLFSQQPNICFSPRVVMNNNHSNTHYRFSDNKYAVIISGGANVQINHIRYWNDCALIHIQST